MTLLPAELWLVAAEVARTVSGRPLQKVVQPDERTLVLGFPGAWLRISLDRQDGCIHLIEGKPPGTGEAASAFCMLLRKELAGLKLVAVEAVAGERALGLDFARAGAVRRLLVFLYGAGAHVVVVDEESRSMGVLGGARIAPHARVVLPPPRADDRPARFAVENISQAVAAHYESRQQGSTTDSMRAAAMVGLKRELTRLRRLEKALGLDFDRIAATGMGRRHADLLLAHLGEVPKGASEVTVADDFAEGQPVTISLDPSRSAQQNAAKLYHEYRRLQRGRTTVEKRLAEARRSAEAIERTLAAIEVATADELPSLTLHAADGRASATNRAAANPRKSQAAVADRSRLPYRVFRSTNGGEILVGKGANKNEELTFHVARGNDLWLHTRDLPGAHVVVPLGGRGIDEQTLLDAAMLAVYHSPARPASTLDDEVIRQVQADVTYALRKLVRKPKKAPAGSVSIAGGKTIRIRLEPARLRRLLATRSES